jgi:hypothetical protein
MKLFPLVQGLPKTFLQTPDILQSKLIGNGSHIYEVNFDDALGTAVPRHNTFSHA